jgi:hypothetical protein
VTDRVLYENRQIAYAAIVVGAVIDVFLAATGAKDPQSAPVVWAGFGIIAAIIVMFSSLTVRVTETTLEWRLALPWPRVRVPVSELETFELVETPLNFGLQATRYGWLWSIGGPTAIAIRLRDGRKYAFGSSDPQAVIAAINQARRAKGG